LPRFVPIGGLAFRAYYRFILLTGPFVAAPFTLKYLHILLLY
jgi:hypothetical protein